MKKFEISLTSIQIHVIVFHFSTSGKKGRRGERAGAGGAGRAAADRGAGRGAGRGCKTTGSSNRGQSFVVEAAGRAACISRGRLPHRWTCWHARSARQRRPDRWPVRRHHHAATTVPLAPAQGGARRTEAHAARCSQHVSGRVACLDERALGARFDCEF